MKKVFLAATALYLIASASASAQLVIQPTIDIGAAQPVVVEHPWAPEGYDPRHRNHDMRYWHDHAHDHDHDHDRR